MPTNVYTSSTFSGVEPAILAHEKGCAYRGLTLDLTFLQADANGDKFVKPGAIVSRLSTGLGRVYGITRTTAAVTGSSDTTITVADASIFKNAEALIVQRPYAIVTFANTWATADVANVVIDGTNIGVAVTTSTLATCATEFAAGVAANPLANSKVQAIAAGALVYLFSRTGVPYTVIAGADGTAGNGTNAITGVNATTNQMLSNVSIGSIHASTAINTTTNVITLAAAASVSLPIGAPIGVFTPPADILGIVVNRLLLASTSNQIDPMVNDVAAFYDATVYQARLPYWDAALSAQFPEINLV